MEKLDFINQSKNALRKKGFRITKARLAVLGTLADSTSPKSPRLLFEEISNNKEAPSIDQVSVYRILDTLLEIGLIHQVFPSGGYLPCFHQSCKNTNHVLLRCKYCETIEEIDIPEEILNPIFNHLKQKKNFTPDKHIFQMDGKCRNCS